MTLRIYQLTPIGHRLARSVSNPDSAAYRIVHFLDQQGQSTSEQVAEFCGISEGEASAILSNLRRKKVVREITGVEA